jgi:HK97 gp10 family phage protein
MTTETRVAGLKELLAGLNALPAELGKKAIWSALTGGAKPVKDRAVALVPVLDQSHPLVRAGQRKPGTLKKAIRVSRSKINKGQRGLYEVIIRIKPLKSAQKKRFKAQTGLRGTLNPDDPFYWRWVEFGTSKMPARPFLRPAFATTKTEQLERMRVRMVAGIELQARKIAAEVNRAA